MEQMRPAFYGLVAPFEAGGQEPSECQARPPRKCGHAAEVQGHKQDRARSHLSQSLRRKEERHSIRLFPDSSTSRVSFTHLGDGRQHLQSADADWRRERVPTGHRVACPEPGHVGTAHDKVADGEEHDRPLGVAKPRGVDQERQHGEEATGATHGGPGSDPVAQDGSFVLGEEQRVTRGPAVLRYLWGKDEMRNR